MLTSCDDSDATVLEPLVFNLAADIPAAQIGKAGRDPVSGEFTKFSFKTGTVATDTSWDNAFRGTDILINGGSKIGDSADEPERTGDVGCLYKQVYLKMSYELLKWLILPTMPKAIIHYRLEVEMVGIRIIE
jgi:hypothetical protein